MDKTFRRSKTDIFYSDLDYIYLGLRGSNNLFSSNTQFIKALDIFIENYAEKEYSEGYRHLFKYLDYSPIIKIEYSIPKRIDLEEKLNNIFDNRPSYYSSLNNINYEELLERFSLRHNDVEDFVYGHEENEIILNFSIKHINRIDNDHNLYRDDVTRYRVLQLLSRLRIARRITYNIYKSDGLELDFKEASSGETAILSTLFALIPLVEDNTLILIDEPEISLHPYWQSQYIRLLDKILEERNNCHTIIATHSHLMLSDLPADRSSILSFIRNGKKVDISFIEESTFGWSAENILLNVFGVPSTRNYYLSNQVSNVLILIRDRKQNTKEFYDIASNLREYLPQLKTYDPLKDIIETIIGVYNEYK